MKKKALKITGMITDGNKLAIRVEVPGWVEALNLKGFECAFGLGNWWKNDDFHQVC